MVDAGGERGNQTRREIEGSGLGRLSALLITLHSRKARPCSTYARGTESLTDTYRLDTTPYGRRQAFEGSPPGWPQNPTYGKPATTPADG